MIIDNSFQDQVAEARSRQRTDGRVQIPQMKKAYPDLFRAQVKGEGSLGKLYPEAFFVTPENEEISRSVRYMDYMKTLIQEIMDSDEVVEASEACGLKEPDMEAFDSATREINRVYAALEDYAKLMNTAAQKLQETDQTLQTTRNSFGG